jgi:predicted nucleotidyltransferase
MKISQKRLEKPTRQKIQALAEAIVHKFHPEKIVLFGSHAYGTPTRESDVDLLIIMKARRRPVEQAVAIRRAMNCPFPIDLLVRTPEQIEERLRLGDFFLREILSRGKVLYAADHA